MFRRRFFDGLRYSESKGTIKRLEASVSGRFDLSGSQAGAFALCYGGLYRGAKGLRLNITEDFLLFFHLSY